MDRWEHRIGEYVKGAYSVLDPDGRIRTVDYEVDGHKGYHAVIRMNEPGECHAGTCTRAHSHGLEDL